jgi:pyrroline-5-carboxylate reductase
MNVGLLGAGRIVRALVEGWSLPGGCPGGPEHLTFFDVVPDRAAALAADTGGVAADDPESLVRTSDVVIVAVRSPQVEKAVRQVGPLLDGRPLVSVAAGVLVERLRAWLPQGAPVGRVIPNVAAAQGMGVFLFVSGTLGSGRDAVAGLFSGAGTVIEIEEEHLDVATAVASCMPGYVARLAEAFTAAGIEGGLPAETARTVALDGLRGAAAVVAAAGDPAAVMAAAATPGGMTAAGIATLDAHDIGGIVDAVVKAAAAQAVRPAGDRWVS